MLKKKKVTKTKKKVVKSKKKHVNGRDPECKQCPLHKTSEAEDKKLVCLWGHGNEKSDIMLIGEAPGKDEIIQGIPFIGESGKLLTKYLKEAGIDRKNIYITNSVKCRPPSNRAPKPSEVKKCADYLDQEIYAQKPKVIGLLGAVALKRVLNADGITKLRGKPMWSDKYQCYCVPTWHPSFIIRRGEDMDSTEQFVRDLKLIKQIGETGETNQLGTDVIMCDNLHKISLLAEHVKKAKVVSVDTETVGDYLTGKIIMVQFSWKPGEAWVIPFYKFGIEPFWARTDEKVIWKILKELLEDINIKKVGQNIKYDYQFFRLHNIRLRGVVFDTMLAHYLLDENDKGGHGLTDLSLKYTDMGDYANELYEILGVKETDVDSDTYAKAPLNSLAKYAGKDSDCTLRVFINLFPKLKSQGLLVLLQKVMVPLSFALADMELIGVSVDVEYYKKLAIKYKHKIDELEEALNDFPEVNQLKDKQKKPVNFNSSDQMRVLFYDILKLPILKYVSNKNRKTKGPKKPSTDKDVLEKLADHHEIPKVIQEHRKLRKFLSTYIAPIPDLVKSDGKLHTSYKQHVTVTGRLSSSNPNLQNIPIRDSEKAKEVRNGIIASPGYVLLEADFGQIEFRLLANECGDETMITDISNKDLDIHKKIASIGFGIPYEEVTQEIRDKAKTIVYSVIYGKSEDNLAKETDLSLDQVKGVFDAIFTRYPGMKRWMENTERRAESVGEVVNWIGRRRRLYQDFNSGNPAVKEHAKRQAVNSPIQGGAHDILSIATLRVRKALYDKALESRLVLTIHDSLCVEVKKEELDIVIKLVKTEMERPIPKINVSMVVDIKTGTRFGEMKKLKLEEIPK
ncbi:MAG: hypothetical protein E2O29_01570 [Deltaproteobacteria bacterium]|nr:MAG: hypothetical protein E2O29_01570 [Deltaproteobacteria bacterium]